MAEDHADRYWDYGQDEEECIGNWRASRHQHTGAVGVALRRSKCWLLVLACKGAVVCASWEIECGGVGEDEVGS